MVKTDGQIITRTCLRRDYCVKNGLAIEPVLGANRVRRIKALAAGKVFQNGWERNDTEVVSYFFVFLLFRNHVCAQINKVIFYLSLFTGITSPHVGSISVRA
tara:strand:- start:16 stop:321 length:306 start_codon:yes stop_codon:yes gene_type:complete